MEAESPAARPIEAKGAWLASRIAIIGLAFAALSMPAARVGDPASPAYEALEDAIDKGGAIDFAILGNSRSHVGLSPKLVAEGLAAAGVTGKRGVNFSVDGTDAVHHASFALHGLLAEKAPPRVIVWAVDPLMFDGSRKANRLEQLRRGDLPLLYSAGAPLELVFDVATMQVFPPYRHRPLVLAKIEDKTEGLGKRLVKVQRAFGLEYVERPKARTYEKGDAGFEPFVVEADWEFRFYQRHGVHYAAEYKALALSDWHERYAARFLERAKAQGVAVMLLEMPVSPYYREKFAGGAKHLAWRDRMRRLAEGAGATFVSEADRYGSDRDFGDPGHLPRATALDYSRHLGEVLARDPRLAAALGASPSPSPAPSPSPSPSNEKER